MEIARLAIEPGAGSPEQALRPGNSICYGGKAGVPPRALQGPGLRSRALIVPKCDERDSLNFGGRSFRETERRIE